MQPPSVFTASLFNATSNLAQILNHKRCAGGGTLDKSFGENVVAVSPKPLLSARHLFKMTFSRFCAFGLKRPFEAEGTAVNLFPGATAQEFTSGSDGRPVKAQVYSDNLTIVKVGGSGKVTTTCSQKRPRR